MSKNKVKFGLKNVHYALLETGTDGAITYGTPKKLSGAVNFTWSPEGSSTPFYADDVTYFMSNSNNGYTGELEFADISDDFKVDVLGEVRDENGALIENSEAIIKPFALLFEVSGDAKNRRNVFYNVTVGRISGEAKTNGETREPITDKLSYTASQRPDTRDVKASLELSETNATVYNSFYENVYEQVAK